MDGHDDYAAMAFRKKFIQSLPNMRKIIMYVDSCSGHSQTRALADALEDFKTELRYFPPNATHLIQPADSFVIQKIKQAWAARW